MRHALTQSSNLFAQAGDIATDAANLSTQSRDLRLKVCFSFLHVLTQPAIARQDQSGQRSAHCDYGNAQRGHRNQEVCFVHR